MINLLYKYNQAIVVVGDHLTLYNHEILLFIVLVPNTIRVKEDVII